MNIKLQSWQMILIGLIAGALTGLVVGHKVLVLAPLGELFIRAIHMIIVPVVFFAIVNAICSVDSLSKMRRLSIKAVFIYSAFMLLASTLALLVAYYLRPGIGIGTAVSASKTIMSSKVHSFGETIVGILPNNIFESFTSGNIIQILVFSIIFGIALNSIKTKSKIIHDFVDGGFQLVIKIAQLVMKMAPIGVFALIACMTGEYGITVVLPLMKLIITVYLGCFLVWICYALFLILLARSNPLKFFKLILKPMLVAYTTSSSAATLPVTLNCAINDLKIDLSVANFLLPLGTSLNLNGLSIYLSIATVFSANVFGIHLTLTDYMMIPFLVLGTAMGAAAVPGSALIVMGVIQSLLGIPLGAIPLIAAVDRINDMAQTSTNVVGDLFATYVINHLESKTDKVFSSEISNSVV